MPAKIYIQEFKEREGSGTGRDQGIRGIREGSGTFLGYSDL